MNNYEFFFNSADFNFGMSVIQSKANNLRIKPLGTTVGKNSPALSTYVSSFEEFNLLFNKYKTMLVKDLAAVKDIANSIELMEERAKKELDPFSSIKATLGIEPKGTYTSIGNATPIYPYGGLDGLS